jgi:hypothetical protein
MKGREIQRKKKKKVVREPYVKFVVPLKVKFYRTFKINLGHLRNYIIFLQLIPLWICVVKEL